MLTNPLLPLYLCLLAIPSGIALQTILTLLAMLLMLGRPKWLCRRHLPDAAPLLGDDALRITAIACLLVAWNIGATLLNPDNVTRKWLSFPFGYLPFLFLPLLMVKAYGGRLSTEQIARLERFFGIICAVWGVIAISQFLTGWRVQGSRFILDEHRPYGLFSHPLSLAYSVLAFWPLALWRVIYHPRRIWSWVIWGGLSVIIVLTMSRTVQIVALLTLLSALGSRLHGKALVGALVLVLVACCSVMFTQNRISERFLGTFSQQGFDRSSSYPDDRLAFWDAHWQMVKERPLLGHGIDLDTPYRTPYYEKIGLAAMPKKYPAHNMFLQELAEGGIIGLVLLVAWWGYFVLAACRRLPRGEPRTMILWMIGSFALASLTQNSFQDADVRMALSFLGGAALLTLYAAPPVKPQPSTIPK